MPLFTSQSKIFLKFPVWLTLFFLSRPADSSGQLSSSPLSSSMGHRGFSNHPLHPPLLSPSSMNSSPGQLHSPISTLSSPINGLSSPYPVISSPMGHPSMSGPSSTSMTFRPSLSPQVRQHCVYCGLINSFSMNCCGQQHRVLLQILSEACSGSIFFSRVCLAELELNFPAELAKLWPELCWKLKIYFTESDCSNEFDCMSMWCTKSHRGHNIYSNHYLHYLINQTI